MKKKFLFLLLLFVVSGLFAEEPKLYRNEIYRNIEYPKELFLYEVMDENNKIYYYEIKTSQNYYDEIIIYIRSYDKKLLTKFLNDLRQCEDKDFKKYITRYAENHDNLTFLWEDYKVDNNEIDEYLCYKLE